MDGGVPRSIETVVIGAGHAGLLMSWHLQQAGRDHVVLDRREVLGGSWQDRWDGFRLVGPNWTTDYPGYPYDDGDPDGFMTRDEVAGRTRRYADVIGAPVSRGVAVQRLTTDGAGDRRFRLETSAGPILADDVIVATGAFHTPRIPAAAAGISTRTLQLHAHDYRSPSALPPGGVLIVGSGQTGVQLAEELHEAGRPVMLSVGHCGRAPRRYRGHDFFWWFRQLATRGPELGTPLPSVDRLPDPRMQFACNPALSGHDGGHETNLRTIRERRDPADRALHGRGRRARHVRRGPGRQPPLRRRFLRRAVQDPDRDLRGPGRRRVDRGRSRMADVRPARGDRALTRERGHRDRPLDDRLCP